MTKKHLPRIVCTAIALLVIMGYFLDSRTVGTLPYYLPENEPRYESYTTANPEVLYETAVAYVNSGVDKTPYSDIQIAENPESTLVLCTKNYALPIDYVPDGLVSIGGTFTLRSDAAENFLKMKAEAKDAGLNFVVYSAYRSGSRQRSIYNSYVSRGGSTPVDSYSARPGHSEHQTGLAIDILQKSGYSSLSSARFQNTNEYTWLKENAHKYGFILRYPSGYTDITGYIFEPWHWRYVGKETASFMYENGIVTYEEYYGKYIAADTVPYKQFTPVTYEITYDNKEYSIGTYNISGKSYFRLRDIAYILSGTEACFDIIWDGENNTVCLIFGAPYTITGVELTGLESISPAQAIRSDTRILYGDKTLAIEMYSIGGNCFVNLQDFIDALNLTI